MTPPRIDPVGAADIAELVDHVHNLCPADTPRAVLGLLDNRLTRIIQLETQP